MSLPITPLESAFAPGPTAAPLDDILATHSETFDTPDGATITGELYGSGETADTDIPKLFLATENDTVVPLRFSRALYDLAAEPKEWQTDPGYAHGTDLFDSESGEEGQQQILQFILAVAASEWKISAS